MSDVLQFRGPMTSPPAANTRICMADGATVLCYRRKPFNWLNRLLMRILLGWEVTEVADYPPKGRKPTDPTPLPPK